MNLILSKKIKYIFLTFKFPRYKTGILETFFFQKPMSSLCFSYVEELFPYIRNDFFS